MRIDCIIVEDEPLALERVKGYIEKVPWLHLSAIFYNATDAFGFLQSHQPGLLFLDINLGDFSGIRLLETAKIECKVIITTAYDEYAVKGFDLQVTDYLLKPFAFDRFLQAVERVRNEMKLPDHLFIKTENRIEQVKISDILYIEGMRDYRKVHTKEKKIMTLKTFGEFENELPDQLICRVHKSFMVSIDKIKSVNGHVIQLMDREIPVSETYRKIFYVLIGR